MAEPSLVDNKDSGQLKDKAKDLAALKDTKKKRSSSEIRGKLYGSKE